MATSKLVSLKEQLSLEEDKTRDLAKTVKTNNQTKFSGFLLIILGLFLLLTFGKWDVWMIAFVIIIIIGINIIIKGNREYKKNKENIQNTQLQVEYLKSEIVRIENNPFQKDLETQRKMNDIAHQKFNKTLPSETIRKKAYHMLMTDLGNKSPDGYTFLNGKKRYVYKNRPEFSFDENWMIEECIKSYEFIFGEEQFISEYYYLFYKQKLNDIWKDKFRGEEFIDVMTFIQFTPEEIARKGFLNDEVQKISESYSWKKQQGNMM